MVKKIAVRVGVLTAVFIAAVTIFSYLLNSKNPDMNVDMGMAFLPRVSVKLEDRNINPLAGYTKEMELTSMRDTITPVSGQKMELLIDRHEAVIDSLTYQVYTLDGSKCLQEETIDKVEDKVILRFKDDILMEERALKITLHLKKQDINYYTRIITSGDTNVEQTLDFVERFHDSVINKEDREMIAGYMETEAGTDSSSYRQVTINSNLDMVMWGSLRPMVLSDVVWELKECNDTYNSVLLTYRVKLKNQEESPDAIYTVKEYFKVRIWREKEYLLDYERTMDQFFDPNPKNITEKGIVLGITRKVPQFETDKDGKTVVFEQNNELWRYDKEEKRLACLFSFSNTESVDERHYFDRHEVKIISVEQNNVIFTVTGYMNRGAHEGSVGVAVYEFKAKDNTVEEKVFIPTNKGFDVMKGDLGRQVFYSRQDEKLYVMMSGTLYCVDMEEDTREVLVHGLEEGQYAMSEDGRYLAYQEIGGKLNQSERITVLNFKNGKSFQVNAKDGEYIKPIGFIRDDFAYGVVRTQDKGITAASQKIQPMYKVEIVNHKGKVVKTYEEEGIFISDGYIEGNMLTLERVTGSPDSYNATAPDYITNNQQVEESAVKADMIGTEERGRIGRLTFINGLDKEGVEILHAKQVQYDKAMYLEFDEAKMQGKYYVYSRGELKGVYSQAGYAVRSANAQQGTAISSSQNYVWERGNLPTAYEVEGFEPFTTEEGRTAIETCIHQILISQGQEKTKIKDVTKVVELLNLTGCSIDEILYTVSRNTPVIAITGPGNAVLITGYNKTNIAYIDPADGQSKSVTKEEMQNMVGGNGNAFIGYIK